MGWSEQLRQKFDKHKKIFAGVVAIVSFVTAGIGLGEKLIEKHTLSAAVYSVEDDEEGALIGASDVNHTTMRRSLPGSLVRDEAKWVANTLSRRFLLGVDTLTVRVKVPADLSEGDIEVSQPEELPIPIEQHLYLVQEGQKSRLSLGPQTSMTVLPQMESPFLIELKTPGFETALVKVTPKVALNKTVRMRAVPLSIGVEKFDGEDGSAVHSRFVRALEEALAPTPVVIKDPKTLDALKRRIEKEKAPIARFTPMQADIRTRLGIDVLVRGSYHRR